MKRIFTFLFFIFLCIQVFAKTLANSDPDLAYIPNQGSNNVSVINTSTNAVVATIIVGNGPQGISVSNVSNYVYVTNRFDNTVSVISSITNTVVATIPVGSNPVGVAVTPNGSRIYVANYESKSISVINSVTNSVVKTISVGNNPLGVSTSPDGSRVYVANISDNTLMVINTLTNTVSATIAVNNFPYGITVSPDGNRIYITNWNGSTVSIINSNTYSIIAIVDIGFSPNCIYISPDGSRVYVSNFIENKVSVLNTVNNTVVATVAVGILPYGGSVSSDGSVVYVANFNGNTVSVINTTTNTLIVTVSVGINPTAFGNFIKAGTNCTNAPPPTFSALPLTSFINCPATPAFTTPTAKDYNSIAIIPIFTDKILAGICAANYSITRTWTATDGCGKSSTASQTINVQGVSLPTIAPLPAEKTIDCPLSPEFTQAVASDDCGSVNLKYVDVTIPGLTTNAYTITRTWTAKDGCDNSATASQIIYVRDMEQPIITQDGSFLIASLGKTYQWYSGERIINGETNPTFFPLTFGDYKVKVINAAGCSRFSEFIHSDTDFETNCPQIHKNFGAKCDDGDAQTINDHVRSDCNCRGDYFSNAIQTKCPNDMTVVSTSIYGTVIDWNDRDMFTPVSGFCNLPDKNISVKQTSGYYSGYPFPIKSVTYISYVATDACGNKSSCSFYIRTTDFASATEEPLALSIKPGKNKVSTGEIFTLHQNIPNPFDNLTTIGFDLPSDENAQLTFVNLAGQIVFVKKINGTIGYNEVSINKSELKTSGILFYRLDTKDNSSTKRMIIID